MSVSVALSFIIEVFPIVPVSLFDSFHVGDFFVVRVFLVFDSLLF